ncbi:hypothetical protein AciX9_3571 [Granulicella tundricola MP5ACTX9]|uniref:Uncharacterized protein n=1 Tax=Granulicella tundricola (strain ATCC BAA-1859 / DSM 23138 / MP5ACTX9) TaxID=1198114 RepID=E8X4T6_GRATM|nr:hypothetical protein AciX9_3571 [Granulicella tundricola MP5ACTX9]
MTITPNLMRKLKQLLCVCAAALDLAGKGYDLYRRIMKP